MHWNTRMPGTPRPTPPPLAVLTILGVALVLVGLLVTGIGMLTVRPVIYAGWALCIIGAVLQAIARFRTGSK